MVKKLEDEIMDLLNKTLELVVKQQREFKVKIQENIKSLLK